MKHKYAIFKDPASQQIVIQEYAELDKEMFSLLCEERYAEADLRAAIPEGEYALIAAFRTRNFYPTYTFAAQIATALKNLLGGAEAETQEVLIDDADFLHRQRPDAPAATAEPDEESEDIDDLLEDGVEEDFEDIDIDKINTGIKIADDDSADLEEDG